MKANFFFLAVTIVFLYSCDKQDQTSIHSGKYSIEIIDSVQINRMMAYPSLVSTHPENRNLLILTSEGGKSMLLIIGQDGKIVKEFEHPKEGPKSVGSNLLSATFFDDGYALMGMGSIVIYDADFSVKKRMRIPLDIDGIIYVHSKHLKVIEKDGRSQLLIFYGPETEKLNIEAEYYEEYNILTLVDPELETFEPYGRFHEGSMFKSGKAFYFIRTFFDVSGKTAKVIVNNDTVLYTFDNTGNELKRTKIPFDNYFMFKGFSLGQQGYAEQGEMRDLAGEILSLLQVDDFDIITYKSGLSLETALDMAGPKGETYDPEEFDKANPRKVIILKEGALVSEVLSLPKKLIELSVKDPFGNIWAAQNVNALDEEPDMLTLYKLRIIEK
ncbi:hypothetical protein ACFCT7_11690 [Fulvivirgaceae bacterium LMO-SS25]